MFHTLYISHAHDHPMSNDHLVTPLVVDSGLTVARPFRQGGSVSSTSLIESVFSQCPPWPPCPSCPAPPLCRPPPCPQDLSAKGPPKGQAKPLGPSHSRPSPPPAVAPVQPPPSPPRALSPISPASASSAAALARRGPSRKTTSLGRCRRGRKRKLGQKRGSPSAVGAFESDLPIFSDGILSGCAGRSTNLPHAPPPSKEKTAVGWAHHGRCRHPQTWTAKFFSVTSLELQKCRFGRVDGRLREKQPREGEKER